MQKLLAAAQPERYAANPRWECERNLMVRDRKFSQVRSFDCLGMKVAIACPS